MQRKIMKNKNLWKKEKNDLNLQQQKCAFGDQRNNKY